MKIRQRMLIGNLVVGMIPVLLAIIIFTIAITNQANNEVQSSMTDTINEIKEKIDNQQINYQNYAYFFAKSVMKPDYKSIKNNSVGTYSMNLNVFQYGLKILEITVSNEVLNKQYDKNENVFYLTEPDVAESLWKIISQPQNNPGFKLSEPHIVSNTVVYKNAAIIFNDKTLEKIGMAIVGEVIDSEYLAAMTADNPDLIIFTETPGGFVFSKPELDTPDVVKILSNPELTNKAYDLIKINNEDYYVSKTFLNRKVTANIGILYGFKSVNKIMVMFQQVAIFVFFISILIAAGIAFFFARQITVPILTLKELVGSFQENLSPIPPPAIIKDEINDLQMSFSDMAQAIITKTEELQSANKAISALVEQQHGDYYLTSLLISPLVPNAVSSQRIKIDFYVNQKKKFRFRNWESQLGGDICLSRNLTLRGRKYAFFANGDAMGKSMQGAGGALVMGVVLNSFIENTMNSKAAQDVSPEEWVHACYNQLEAIFESFDGSMMMSAIIGIVEEDTGKVYYFNAEHPWLVLYRDGKADFAEDETEVGKKLGTVGFAQVYIKSLQMQKSDVLIMGSDGKDDVKLGIDQGTGFRIINEDETAFLRHVEKGAGDLAQIADYVIESGELTDDFTMLRIGFMEGMSSEISQDVQEEMPQETLSEDMTPAQVHKKEDLDVQFNTAYENFKSGKFQDCKDMLGEVYGKYETDTDKFKVSNLMGHACYRLNLYEDALKFWEEALNYSSGNEKVIQNIESLKKKIGVS